MQIVNAVDYLVAKYLVGDRISFYRFKTISMDFMGAGCGRALYLENVIIVQRDTDRQSQIKEVLHQLVHMHPVFLDYTMGVKSKHFEGRIFKRDKEQETLIEKIIDEICEKRRDVVDKINKYFEVVQLEIFSQ